MVDFCSVCMDWSMYHIESILVTYRSSQLICWFLSYTEGFQTLYSLFLKRGDQSHGVVIKGYQTDNLLFDTP